jgi:hypothetical protein
MDIGVIRVARNEKTRPHKRSGFVTFPRALATFFTRPQAAIKFGANG